MLNRLSFRLESQNQSPFIHIFPSWSVRWEVWVDLRDVVKHPLEGTTWFNAIVNHTIVYVLRHFIPLFPFLENTVSIRIFPGWRIFEYFFHNSSHNSSFVFCKVWIMRCPPIEVKIGSLVLKEEHFVSIQTLRKRSCIVELANLSPFGIERSIKSHHIEHMSVCWKIFRGNLIEKSGVSVGFRQVALYRVES